MAFILIPYIVILSWGANFTGVVEYSGLVVTCRAVLSANDTFVRILAGGAYCVGVAVVSALAGGVGTIYGFNICTLTPAPPINVTIEVIIVVILHH